MSSFGNISAVINGKGGKINGKRINRYQDENFWQRNMDFIKKKKLKIEACDEWHSKDVTFKPEIGTKSRQMSERSSQTRSQQN